MSSSDPEHDGGPDAENPTPTPKPDPLDVDSAFAAIVAGWADDGPTTWPADEDLSQGRHRRVDDPDDPGEAPKGRRAAGRDEDRSDGWDDDQLALSGTGGSMIPSVDQPEEGPEDDIGKADEFVPPDPPPLPRGDLISRLAWAGVVIGPIFMLIAVLAWRTAPKMLVLIALGAFVAGFVTLVARMPNHRDDDGDGAIV
jgi:hypothetical protein